MKEIEYKISDIISILKKNKFIIQEGKYLISTPLGKFISDSYLEIKTGILLCNNIENINKLISNKYIDENKKVKILLIFLISFDEFKPLFKVLEDELLQFEEKIAMNEEHLDKFFGIEITNKRDFPKIIKTTEVLEYWINENEEIEIQKKFEINITRLKRKIKVINHILYSLEKLAKIKHYYFLKNYIIKLRHRFICGIKKELIPISNFKILNRRDLRNLYNFGYKTIYDLKKCDKKDLKYLISGVKYASLKESLSLKQSNLENYELQIPEDIFYEKSRSRK